MSDRYLPNDLVLLQDTQNVTSYGRRRRNCPFTARQPNTASILQLPNHSKQQIYEGKSISNQYVNPVSKSTQQISFNRIRQKLRGTLMKNPQQKTQFSGITETRPKQLFRIKLWTNNLKDKMKGLKRIELGHNDTTKQFNVNEISLKRRHSLTQYRNNPLFQFNRDALRFHGQNKCFQNVIKFKGNSMAILNQSNEKPLNPCLLSHIKQTNIDDSLQYSYQEQRNLSDIQPWKRAGRQNEWMEYSQLTN